MYRSEIVLYNGTKQCYVAVFLYGYNKLDKVSVMKNYHFERCIPNGGLARSSLPLKCTLFTVIMSNFICILIVTSSTFCTILRSIGQRSRSHRHLCKNSIASKIHIPLDIIFWNVICLLAVKCSTFLILWFFRSIGQRSRSQRSLMQNLAEKCKSLGVTFSNVIRI